MKNSTQDYLRTLELEFESHRNDSIAIGQKAYMRNMFEFHGIKAPQRKDVQRPFMRKDQLPFQDDLQEIVMYLWSKPEREYQYFAMELANKYQKSIQSEDMELFEFMIVNKSWWDTVDFVAANLVGNYLKKFPDSREKYVGEWLASGNIWLQRTALIFQLKYKDQLDTSILSHAIRSANGTKEFFINKAIGWALRNHSRVDPDWVMRFVEQQDLNNLSRREALKYIYK